MYPWSTRRLIRATRQIVLQQVLSQRRKGRKPILQVIIDLTTLEKRGKFKALNELIRVYNSKRGLHLVVLYLVVGRWRVPWNFRVDRGKETPSPAQLGLKLVQSLPKALTQHFQVMILVDTAFGSIEFLHGIRQLKYHAIAGVRCDRAPRRWTHCGTVVQTRATGKTSWNKISCIPVMVLSQAREREIRQTLCPFYKSSQAKHYQLVGKASMANRRLVQNCQASFRFTSFWSGYCFGSLPLAGTINDCLFAGTLGVFIYITLQMHLIGDMLLF